MITPAKMRSPWAAAAAILALPVLFHIVIVQTSKLPLAFSVGGVFKLSVIGVAALGHWSLYASLLATFALTLRRGHEPLITAMAYRLHGTLSDEMIRYTRGVTIAWSLFFAAQLLTSVSLFLPRTAHRLVGLRQPARHPPGGDDVRRGICRPAPGAASSAASFARDDRRDGARLHAPTAGRREPALRIAAAMTEGAAHPVLHHAPDATVAWIGRTSVTAAQFRQDVAALAALLPPKAFVVNLCHDRYRFMAGFAAALMRGQVTLMPSANTPGLLKDLAEDHPDLYALTDGAPPDAALGLAHLPFPERLAEAAPAPLLIPGAQPAVVLFTSGSTGRPKPVPKSWGTLVASARAAGTRLNAADFAAGCVIGTVPHQHSYGLESVILLAWQHGLAISAACPLFPADVRSALEAAPAPRLLVTTPVHLRTLVAEADGMPPAGLIVSATAPLPAELAAQAEACFQAAADRDLRLHGSRADRHPPQHM